MTDVRQRRSQSPQGDDTTTTITTTTRPGVQRRRVRNCFLIVSTILVVLAVVLFLIINFYPYRIQPNAFTLPTPRRIDQLPVKYQSLRKVATYLKGQVQGAESVVVINEDVYAGLEDHRIVRMHNFIKGEAKVETITRLKNRPLGMRLHPVTGELLIIDAVQGVIAVNPKTGSSRYLMMKNSTGSPFILLNDLDITKDGRYIFFSEFGRHPYKQVYLTCLEADYGRLMRLDTHTGEVKVLLHGSTNNGVQVHSDGVSVLVSECLRFRIIRYYFAGTRAGETEVFVNNLPGAPDNIRPSVQGGYWVGFGLTRLNDNDHYNFYDKWGAYPRMRQLMSLMPSSWIMSKIFTTADGSAVRLDDQGQIVQLIREETSKHGVTHITQVNELANGTLLLGTFSHTYIQRIDKHLLE